LFQEKKNYHGEGVLNAILGGGEPPGHLNPDPLNPDPISEQNMPFPAPIFRAGLKNPYPFQNWFLKVAHHLHTISNEVNMSLKHFVII